MEKTVLCYIEKDDMYLMLYRNKKSNDLNANKWIGIGGHIEKGETQDDALLREVKEETNLLLLDYKLRGKIFFQSGDFEEIMFLYTASGFQGKIKECNEGELHFIKKKEVLKLNLWEGDRIFLDYLSNDEPYFELKLVYDGDKLVFSERLV